jgi:pantoate--beta-alanine ligase
MRLDAEARAVASALPRQMSGAARALRADTPVPQALAAATDGLLAAGFDRVDYMDLCDAQTLLWIDQVDGPARLLAAAWVGGVRLIDNIAV